MPVPQVKLTNFQAIMMLGSSYLPLMFWIFPRIATETAETDAQWAMIGTVIMGMIIAILQGMQSQRFPKVSGAIAVEITFGKWLGKGLQVIYILFYILFIAISLYLFIHTIRMFLPLTPRLVLMTALVIISVIGALYGIAPMSRTAGIIHPFTYIGIFITYIYVISQVHWYGVPRTYTSSFAVLHGVYALLPLFFGFNIYVMFSPYVNTKYRSLFWVPVVSATVGSTALLLVFAATEYTLGWDAVKMLNDPAAFVVRLVKLNNWLIERVGVFLIILTTLFQCVFTSAHIWCMSNLTAQVFSLPQKRYRSFVVPVAIAVTTVAAMFKNDEIVDWILKTILTPTSWILLIGIPLSTVIVAWMRGVATDENGQVIQTRKKRKHKRVKNSSSGSDKRILRRKPETQS